MKPHSNDNYSKVKPFLFLPPLFFLITLILFLYSKDALCVNKYIQIQKDSFFFINHHLRQYPNLIYNLTQFGDCLVFSSFISILIVYTPKIWESLLSTLIVTLIFSCLLKHLFAVPRPAAVFDNTSFFIAGKAICAHNSLPSGHSITIFATLTILMFPFAPKNLKCRILYYFTFIILGSILAFTRVGIGAHYPLDVIIGSIIGYISGLLGIFITRKYNIWTWINNKKYYPILILIFVICSILLVCRIINTNLIIFYLALISLVFPLYKLISLYIKK
ncbi:phosphatase PAP2 family protein [Flavobacterium sp. T12S277]|uniref:phosphatase PAP2 family protein n=1 Tax=Flavobacterium sp. T12S277 TaxID=3402752 RepID=UPI003AE0E14D